MKTKYMVVGGKGKDLIINDNITKCVDHFNCLGSLIDSSGTCGKDITNHVNEAAKAIRSMNRIPWRTDVMEG